MASFIPPLENTTEAIECWPATSFHLRMKKWPRPLGSVLSPPQTSHLYFPSLPHSTLFLLDHSLTPEHALLSPIWLLWCSSTSLVILDVSQIPLNPTYQNFKFICCLSVFWVLLLSANPLLVLSFLVNSTMIHSCSSQKPPNSFLPSPLISNPSVSPVNSVPKIHRESIHFSSYSQPPPP